jgi:hypothetical protein
MNDERFTAYHEAGHVVVGIKLGRKLDRVTIVPSGRELGKAFWRDKCSTDVGIQTIFSGDLAELMFRQEEYRYLPPGYSKDALDAHSLGADANESELCRLAWQELTKHWKAVQAIADALMDPKILSEIQVTEILKGIQGRGAS